MTLQRVVVVGAGMAGLVAAGELQAAGLEVVVLDKGRVVGGRMATRTIGDATFDHGAQHFSVRSDAFGRFVAPYRHSGLVTEWFRSQSLTLPERGVEPRHVVRRGMRRLPEALASDLRVVTGVVVDGIERREGEVVVSVGATRWSADAAVVTPPGPQTAALLGSAGVEPDVLERLDAIAYHPCLAVMATLDGPSGLEDGHTAPGAGNREFESRDEGIVAWIGDNRHKGVSPVDAVTVHATPDFSARHLDDAPEIWLPRLNAAASRVLASKIESVVTHRWRYAQPIAVFDEGALFLDGSAPIVVAGEAFAGARVEGAFLSGEAAAGLLLDR